MPAQRPRRISPSDPPDIRGQAFERLNPFERINYNYETTINETFRWRAGAEAQEPLEADEEEERRQEDDSYNEQLAYTRYDSVGTNDIDFIISGQKIKMRLARTGSNTIRLRIATDRGSYSRILIQIYRLGRKLVFNRPAINPHMTLGARLASRDGEFIIAERKEEPPVKISN